MLPAETQQERTPQQEVHTREKLGIKTEVPVEIDAATGPTAASDFLREVVKLE